MSPEAVERMKKMMAIFNPYITERYAALGVKKRVVLYTSAENLFKILSTRSMWMRNTNCMSDYSEVVHGHSMLQRFFGQDSQRKIFFDAIDTCHTGVGTEAVTLFDQWWSQIRANTYITSISEHESSEDVFGRLSMWRTFGQNSTARAAMVLTKCPRTRLSRGP